MKLNSLFVPALLALSVPIAGYAQSFDPETEELVQLSPFEITDNRVSPYRAAESLGGARIRRDLIDTGASINVITSDFLRDIGASSIIDATQYISGVSYGPLSGLNGLFTRQVLRGFEVVQVTFDGFTNMGGFAANVEPEIIERIETIKGPHDLLIAGGQPGGSSNLITKSPRFEAASTIKYEVADQHSAGKVSVDTTGPLIGDVLAYRVVAADQDTSSTVPGRIKNRTLSPSLTWRITPNAQLKLKGYFVDSGVTGSIAGNHHNMALRNDLPPGATATLADVKPEYVYGGANGQAEWLRRQTNLSRGTAEFVTQLGNHISLKLGAVYQYYHYYSNSGGLSINRPGESGINRVNPMTGYYTADQHWQITNPTLPWDEATNPYFSTPVDHSVAGASLAESYQHAWSQESTQQIDLVGQWELPFAKLQVVTGASRARQASFSKYWDKPDQALFGQARTYQGYTPPPLPFPSTPPLGIVNPTDFTYADGAPRPATTTVQTSETWTAGTIKKQAYINAHLDFLDGKLLLNGGVSYVGLKDKGWTYWNQNLYTRAEGFSSSSGEKSPSKTTPSTSAVYKIKPWIAVYGSVAKNAQNGSYYDGNGDTNRTRQVWREGEQTEFGVKMEFFNRRLLVTAAWFDLKQTNINVTHPDRNRDPSSPDLTLPDFLFDISNKGIEFDIVGQITPNLNALVSYTDMELRDQLGREREGAPDRMYNALLRYGFSRGPVKGLSLALGMNHVDKQAGGNPSGNHTPIGVVIPIDFYAPERTIFNASASYEYRRLRFQLNVDNLTDKKTIYQTTNLWEIAPFPRRNVRLTTSYSF